MCFPSSMLLVDVTLLPSFPHSWALAYGRTSSTTNDGVRKNLYCKHTRMVDITPTKSCTSTAYNASCTGGHICHSHWHRIYLYQILLQGVGCQRKQVAGSLCGQHLVRHSIYVLTSYIVNVKKSCKGNYKCTISESQCTALCTCQGNCYKD